jgi:hypothetical protein
MGLAFNEKQQEKNVYLFEALGVELLKTYKHKK